MTLKIHPSAFISQDEYSVSKTVSQPSQNEFFLCEASYPSPTCICEGHLPALPASQCQDQSPC
jgi:hypothetical protein